MDKLPNIEDVRPEDIIIKPKTAPIFDGLPAYLKDHANYPKLKFLIIKSLQGDCKHTHMQEWAACHKCQRRFYEKGQILKNMGFSSPAQYMAWQKVHEEIRRLDGLKQHKLSSVIAQE